MEMNSFSFVSAMVLKEASTAKWVTRELIGAKHHQWYQSGVDGVLVLISKLIKRYVNSNESWKYCVENPLGSRAE